MPTVKFVAEKKSIEVSDGANLRKEAMKNGIKLSTVLVKNPDSVSKSSLMERLRLWMGPLSSLTVLSHADGEVRVASQVRVHGDVEVVAQPGVNWHGEQFWN